MYDTCPTVKICADNEQGFIVINESDFDADVHQLFGEMTEQTAEPARRGRPPKPKS